MDEYDRHIKKLTKFSGRDFEMAMAADWAQGEGLFKFLSPSGDSEDLPPGRRTYHCGCLTQVKNSAMYEAWTPELTARIRADERVPDSIAEVTHDMLPVFAEYQREADRTFRVQPSTA